MTTYMVAILVSLAATAAPRPGASAQAPGPTGHWEGSIQVPAQELGIQVDLAGGPAKWEGTISIPAQGLKGFPLSAISVDGQTVSFAMKGVPGDPHFKGTLSQDGKTLAGDFTQGGGTVAFSLTRTGDAKIEPLPKSTPVTPDLEGSWEGTLDIEGKMLRLVLKLANQAGGAASGTLVSVDQGGAEIPVGAAVQKGTHLTLLIPTIAGTYEGDLKGSELTGTWTQGPRSWPLTFKRGK